MYLEIATSAHLYKDICLDGEVNHMIAASCMIQGKEEDLIRILKEIHEQRQTCRSLLALSHLACYQHLT